MRKLWGWNLVYSIGDSGSTKFVQMMVIGWPLTFLQQGQIWAPIHLCGENVEKSFSQNVLKTNDGNLQCMIKIVKLISYNQYFALLGLPTLAPRLYTCIKLCNFLNGLFSETTWAIFTDFIRGLLSTEYW